MGYSALVLFSWTIPTLNIDCQRTRMIEFVKNSALLGAHTLKFDYDYGSEPNIWELAGRGEKVDCVLKSPNGPK